MLGDSLLDVVHLLTTPALLFDLTGRLLYANRAALNYDEHDRTVVSQVAGQLFPDQASSTQSQKRRHSQSQPHEIPLNIITSRVRSSKDARKTDYTATRPRLRRRGSSHAMIPDDNNGDDYGSEGGTPTGREDQDHLLWKITKTVDRRILALAQDCLHEPLPELVNKEEMEKLRQTKPLVNVPWTLQHRFEPLRRGFGVMADLIRNFDWASHPLGPIEAWPQARVEMVGMILASHAPMTAYLEQEAYVLYNDAFIACLGKSKHPACLGRPAKEVWGEIWNLIEAPMDATLQGVPSRYEDQMLFWERLEDGGPNIMEEVYATWYYTPYWGQDRVIGNLLILFEQQEKQNPISARRTAVLAELSASLSSSRSTIDLCRNTLEVLFRLEVDLPYCMAYTKVAYEPPELLTPTEGIVGVSPDPYISISSAGSISSKDLEEQQNIHVFALQETVGCAFDSAIAPSRIMVDMEDEGGITPTGDGHTRFPGTAAASNPWQKAALEVMRTGEMVEVADIHRYLTDVPHRGLPTLKPYRAVVMPLKQGSQILGFIITLLNPALPWGQDFKVFIAVAMRQINMSLAMVRTFEQETQRVEELAALDRAKTSFFTSVSHEVRTILN